MLFILRTFRSVEKRLFFQYFSYLSTLKLCGRSDLKQANNALEHVYKCDGYAHPDLSIGNGGCSQGGS